MNVNQLLSSLLLAVLFTSFVNAGEVDTTRDCGQENNT